MQEYQGRLKLLKNIYRNHVLTDSYCVFNGVEYCPSKFYNGKKDAFYDLRIDLLDYFLKPYENTLFSWTDSDNEQFEVIFKRDKPEDDDKWVRWSMHEVQKNKKVRKHPIRYNFREIMDSFDDDELKPVIGKNGKFIVLKLQYAKGK
jgi:hypothetical protein